ncbi:MAG: hypothetical protein J5985_00920 [Kiritimatiellae bacterium]|nr:hypothetical protein [Kiritimatiellia bacterium]
MQNDEIEDFDCDSGGLCTFHRFTIVKRRIAAGWAKEKLEEEEAKVMTEQREQTKGTQP